MKQHLIAGGGDCLLNVIETGNPQGRPILFIHGMSQCALAWSRQLGSALADEFRLVAMDLRGHGSSERPDAGYDDSRLWAADVAAVLRALELDQPVLCGWSYGPLVILDYVRHYGDDAIGGTHFVAGVSKLGGEEALSVLTPAFLSLVPGLFSSDAGESVTSLESLVRLCVVGEVPAEERYAMLGYNVSVPPSVRQALLTRAVDNDDVLRALRKPVLLTQGSEDAIVRSSVVELHRARVPHAEVHVMSGAGHAPFWDDATAFNARLAAFCRRIAAGEARHVAEASL